MEENDFELIYEKYVPKVFSFILKLSNNYHIAEEITQETFVKAYISLHTFRGECRTEVWLCQIAKNLFFDFIKKSKRETNSEYGLDESPDSCNIENIMIVKEEIARLNKAVISLKEPCRSVMIDYLFMELSYREIAMKHRRTENWVRVNFYRGKQKIKDYFNNHAEREELL